MNNLTKTLVLLTVIASTVYGQGFLDTLIEGLGEAVNWTVDFAVFLASHKDEMKQVYHDYYGATADITGTMDMYMRIDGAGNIVESKASNSTMGNGFTKLLEIEILTWAAPEKLYNTEMTIGLQFDPTADIYGVDATYEEY
jgi:hypothetical protein